MDNIRKRTLALGLVILVAEYTFVICDGIRWTKYHHNGNTGHKHVEPSEKVFKAEVKKAVTCGKLCHTNSACKSFSYQPDTNMCTGCRTLHCDAPEDSATSMFFSAAKESSGPSTIRLVDGDHTYEGRLEVLQNGQWGTVCSEGFGPKEAMVVCKMLNFPLNYANTYPSTHFKQGTLPILLSDVSCSGSEKSLFKCLHRAWGEADCSHGGEVGMTCGPEVRVRREGFIQHTYTGTLEVFYNMTWTTVCTDSFGKEKAMVVCNMVNRTWAFATTNPAIDIKGDVPPILLDGFSCNGSERSLYECPHYVAGEGDCDYSQRVSISCIPNLHIRLADAEISRSGRVEVSLDGKQWSSVCNNGFDENAAKVVCKMLGYQTSNPHYTVGDIEVYLEPLIFNYIECSGSEESLLLCYYHNMAARVCGFITVECS